MGPTDCNRMRERVSLELDGELSPYESSLLERHLRGCPECAVFTADARRYTELLRAAPLEEAPRFVLPRRRAVYRLSVRVGAAVASTAAAAIVAVSALVFTEPSGNHPAALIFAPSGATVHRPGGGPLGLRHPSAVKPAADRQQTSVLDSPRHALFGS